MRDLIVCCVGIVLLPMSTRAQASGTSDVFGLVDGRNAVQYAVWDGQGWSGGSAPLREGAEVTVLDRIGQAYPATLGPSREEDWWNVGSRIFYRAVGLPELARTESPITMSHALGYWASAPQGHAPFVEVPSPLSEDDWDALLREAEPAGSNQPRRIEATVWQAKLGDDTVTIFQASRSTETECIPWVVLLGVFGSDATNPRVDMKTTHDCHGRGVQDRRPFALIQRAERLMVLFGYLADVEMDGELWELLPTGLVEIPLRR